MIISQKKKRITGPKSITLALHTILSREHEADRNKEHFWVIGLNGANVIQYIDLTTLGIINQTLVHPREVFRMAIMKGVNSIIIAHNHPSGSILPSANDRTTTKQLSEAGKVVGIKVLDHIIIGNYNESEYFSFHERGEM